MNKRRASPQPAIQLLDKGVLRLDSEQGTLSVTYRLNRSRRARYMRLTINRFNEVVLTLPSGCATERGLRFMKTKTEWLRRHLFAKDPTETLSRYLRSTGFLAVEGRRVPIDWSETAGGEGAFLRFDRRVGRVAVGFDPDRDGETGLKDLIRQFASATLARRTMALAARHAFRVNGVSVRDQISRWGSCSVKRNVSLNWRLLLLAPEIKDYVILHELAHLVEMNHSTRFWKVLERLDPEAHQHDRVLTQVANRVMAIGRTPKP